MENNSYTKFLDFYKSHFSEFEKDNNENAYDELNVVIENNKLDLKEVLQGALDQNDFEQINIIIESIRREYFVEQQGHNLYEMLLRTAIDFAKQQQDSIHSDKLWNIKQIFDIDLHQSHLVEEKKIHKELYFELCYEILDPRFKKMEHTDEFNIYGSCLYFVMFSSGFFRINSEYLHSIKPRVQTVIDKYYGKDHHFSKRWIELFESHKE